MQRLLNEDSNRAIDNDPDYVYPACCKSRPLPSWPPPAPPGAARLPYWQSMRRWVSEHFQSQTARSFHLSATALCCSSIFSSTVNFLFMYVGDLGKRLKPRRRMSSGCIPSSSSSSPSLSQSQSTNSTG